jgi:hypothetical protein
MLAEILFDLGDYQDMSGCMSYVNRKTDGSFRQQN